MNDVITDGRLTHKIADFITPHIHARSGVSQCVYVSQSVCQFASIETFYCQLCTHLRAHTHAPAGMTTCTRTYAHAHVHIHMHRFVAKMPTPTLFIMFSFLLKLVEGIGLTMFFTASMTLLTQLYLDRKGTYAVSIFDFSELDNHL